MEVDTRNTDGGSAALSPSDAADGSFKVNGDDDLNFTITMNESEDEASNDTAGSGEPVKKSGKDSSPAQVNGKSTSDDDSQGSTSNDAKGKSDVKKDEETGDSGGERKTRSKSRVKSDHKEPESGEAEVTEKKKLGDGHSDKEDGDNKPIQIKDKEGGKSNTHSDDKQEKDDKSDNKKIKTPVKKDLVKDSVPKEKVALSGKLNEVEDDDVVEIEGSPVNKTSSGLLPNAKNKLNSTITISTSKIPAGASNASNLVLDARTGASVSIMATGTGASLVPSSGVQLVLPQGTPGVQGSAVMYVPNTGTYAMPSYLPAVGSSMQAMARTNAPLFSQYSNMPGNRFVLPTQNQNMLNQNAVKTQNPGMHAMLANIPEKPSSSKGMIDMIRWEVENHINIKPKYVKPNPKAELGNLAKWIFDLGSDMVKEYVYHDLVRIQHRRKDEGNLSAKEKDDFAKLQEIDKELNQKVGHLKYKLSKSCRCGFKTELDSILYHHQQHAHFERGGFLNCAMCKYSTRQPNAFRMHMESEHGRVGKLENRPSFYECPLCPYETNYTNRLEQHKVRCQRQFREAFNLHPSCMTGPEVSMCLENVFYFVFTRQFMNSIIPKPVTPTPTVTSSTTKIRDMPAKPAISANAMQPKKSQGNTVTSTTKHIPAIMAPQFPQRSNAAVRQQQPNSLSRNFPVISSKINTIPSQGYSTYTQSSAPSKQMAPNRPQVPNQLPVPNQPNSGFEVCEICGGYVKDRKALRIHFFYAHRIDMPFGVFERPQPPLYCATCFARFWTAQGLQKHIEVHKNDMVSTTQTNNGVAGKCISCGHRVPNILMHMRMVHNRELRHYLAALMCIFCGNRFLTKKETENHMSKMHGVIVKDTAQGGASKAPPPVKPAPQPRSQSRYPAPRPPPASPAATTPPAPKPSGSGKMNRSSQCVLCNLSFSRNVDLTRHCMRVHHTCMKCGLVVVDKESLSRHTCLHSASGMRTCQICKESGFHPAYYIKHMRDRHLRKCSVVLRRIDRAVVETMKRPITISDSEDDEPLPKQQKINDGGNAERKDQAAGKDEVSSNSKAGRASDSGMKHAGSNKEEGSCKEKGVEDKAGTAGEGNKEDRGKDSVAEEMEKNVEADKKGNLDSDTVAKDELDVKTAAESKSDDQEAKEVEKNEQELEEDKKGADSDSVGGSSKPKEMTDNDESTTKRQTCSQSDKNCESENQVPADNKNLEHDSSDNVDDKTSSNKRKVDNDSHEGGPMRKSLRSSKGADGLELD